MEKEYVTLNSGSKTAARSSKNTKSRRKTGHSKSNIRRSALETKRTGSSRTGMRKVNGSSKSTSPRTSRSKKKSRSRKMDIPVQYIAGGAVLVILLIAIIFAVRSCGISHKTPERVVKALIESYKYIIVYSKHLKVQNLIGMTLRIHLGNFPIGEMFVIA